MRRRLKAFELVRATLTHGRDTRGKTRSTPFRHSRKSAWHTRPGINTGEHRDTALPASPAANAEAFSQVMLQVCGAKARASILIAKDLAAMTRRDCSGDGCKAGADLAVYLVRS